MQQSVCEGVYDRQLDIRQEGARCRMCIAYIFSIMSAQGVCSLYDIRLGLPLLVSIISSITQSTHLEVDWNMCSKYSFIIH